MGVAGAGVRCACAREEVKRKYGAVSSERGRQCSVARRCVVAQNVG